VSGLQDEPGTNCARDSTTNPRHNARHKNLGEQTT
jgi:hypothetical protein